MSEGFRDGAVCPVCLSKQINAELGTLDGRVSSCPYCEGSNFSTFMYADRVGRELLSGSNSIDDIEDMADGICYNCGSIRCRDCHCFY
jgi:hypothetical protein